MSIKWSSNYCIIRCVHQTEYIHSNICLRSLINAKLDPKTEIRARIEQFEGRAISRSWTSLQTIEMLCLAHPTRWSRKVDPQNQLEAFEIWIYRKMLRIPWHERVNNKRDLLNTVKYKKTSYLGHVLRNDKYYSLKLLTEGWIEGKRPIGRKRLSWLKNIRNWTDLNVKELIRTS